MTIPWNRLGVIDCELKVTLIEQFVFGEQNIVTLEVQLIGII